MPVYDQDNDYSVNMTKKPGKEPGFFLAEVTKATRDKSGPNSKNPGTPMIVLTYKDVADDKFLCTDRLMLKGGGWSIAWGKLICLGTSREHVGPINELALVGKRVWMRLIEDSFQGQVNLKPDMKGGGHGGYWAEADRPEGAIEVAPAAATKPIVEDDTPF